MAGPLLSVSNPSCRRIAALALLLVAAAAVQPAGAASPALGVTLTSSGIKVLAAIVRDVVNAGFQDLQIPDIHIDTHVAEPIGHITLDLTNIKVTNFNIATSLANLKAPSSLLLGFSGLDAVISMDYKWRKVNWPHASDHGELTASPKGGTLRSSLALSVAANGTVALAASDTSCSFSSFDLHFDGKVAWLYNLLVDLFKSSIGKSIASSVSKELDRVMNDDVAGALAKMKTSTHIGGGKSEVTIDVGFTGIAAQASMLTLDDAFAMSDTLTGTACPNTPATLPPYTPDAAAAEFQLLFADTLLSCPLWVMYANGLLTFELSAATTPPLAPYLTTKFVGAFLPPLSAKYPDLPLSIAVSAPVAPTLSSSASAGVVAGVDLNLNFTVDTSNTTTAHAFTLSMDNRLGLDVFVNSTAPEPTIEVQLSALNVTLGVVDSSVGSISVSALDKLLAFVLPAVKGGIDKALRSFGIPLAPIDGVGLKNPKVTYDTGFFAITSNLTLPSM